MEKFSSVSSSKQWVILLVAAVAVTTGVYRAVFKPQRQDAAALQERLRSVTAENLILEQYRRNLPALEQQVSDLQKNIVVNEETVPRSAQVDDFLLSVEREAHASGIIIRRYTALQPGKGEMYSVLPIELELDGGYSSMATFYARLAKVKRLVSVSKLLVSSATQAAAAKVKHQYSYAPNETIVATCIVTLYFSGDIIAGDKSALAPQPVAVVRR